MILAVRVRQSLIRLSAIRKAKSLKIAKKAAVPYLLVSALAIISIYRHVGIRFGPINS